LSVEQITREINRRQLLELMAAAGASVLIGCGGSTASGTTTTTTSTGTSSASCVLSPALTIGPYFVDEKLNRSDLTADTNDINVTAAMPLSLVITVQHYSSSGCSPLAGAQVDLWHADAGGKYSDENSEGTSGETYLRGYQVTDSSGLASFKTIFPGWYSGRTVHIHAMVRLFDSSGNQTFEWETQFFFDPTLTTQIMATAPYSTRGTPDTSNSQDNIYSQSGGKTLLNLTKNNDSSGYSAAITLGVQTA
jgi:protocatechuate 3,4-dioxygenase beta subunit